MYLSLDRIDVKLEPRDGRERLIQTDHRSAGEAAARPAFSTIVALIRCLNPRRVSGEIELFYMSTEATSVPSRRRDRLWRDALARDDVSLLSEPYCAAD
jgi:hypothetical protein